MELKYLFCIFDFSLTFVVVVVAVYGFVLGVLEPYGPVAQPFIAFTGFP